MVYYDDDDDDHSSSSEEEECADDTDDSSFLDTPILPSRSLLRMHERAAGCISRSLLGRSQPGDVNPLLKEHASTFSKSAAGEIKRVPSEPKLSCLSLASTSSSSRLSRNLSANELFPPSTSSSKPIPRNVSFSHVQVREYELALGCNPSVQSGVPISLGWNYNPNETRHSLDGQGNLESKSKSTSSLRLSDRERARRLKSTPNISFGDVTQVLREVEKTKIERRETLTLYKRERRIASESTTKGGQSF
ncbi:hypothetical protein THAOC_02548 [Thalassiosira oceanica]|uniref:Uncharacterized protein n=1 Tax=Thalassiosira oceanica TaxID=159749 RepID=K0TLZ0_THAOC|nr:hypothetical protein THAOC_02548 [Thalassiosira oceanica]|eukprot:EJK75721.1 hypothetical protein THAOC_02548 [Thalassiosira oceanica]